MTERLPLYRAQCGDIFACWGTDRISRMISLETSSLFGPSGLRFGPSHVAIAANRFNPDSLRQYWYESTTLTQRPCLDAGRPVSGAQVHPIEDRIHDYLQAGGTVVVYRLTEIDRMSHDEQMKLVDMLQSFTGGPDHSPKTYDTVGAICSGTRYVKRFTAWRNQLDNLFCSELIAAVLQRLCRLCRRNPADYTPARLLRSLVTQGTYRKLIVLRSGQ